ncbi:hypothetical protein D3C85_1660800 [compost metagenome]
MAAKAIAEQRREVAVVHFSGLGGAVFIAEKTAQVAGQRALAHLHRVQQRQGVLLIQVRDFGVIDAQAEVLVHLVIAADIGHVR